MSGSMAAELWSSVSSVHSRPLQLVLVLILFALSSVFLLGTQQPVLSVPSSVSRRLMDHEAAATPVQHYTAPSPPLPEAVLRAINQRAGRTDVDHGEEGLNQIITNVAMILPPRAELNHEPDLLSGFSKHTPFA